MLITSETGRQYEVKWKEHGWGYAIPVVIQKRKVFFGLITLTREYELNQNDAIRPVRWVQQYKPDQMREWFQKALDHQEEYERAWS
jgi:hypothetical protein